MGLCYLKWVCRASKWVFVTPRTGHFLGGGGGADALFETVHISKKIFLNYSKKLVFSMT